MDISEKIEAIRREPEHIRLRYVWGCVALSMFVILIIWLFSIASLFKEEGAPSVTDENATSLKEQLQNISKQAPSIKDYDLPVPTVNEGISENANSIQDINEFQYPTEGITTDTPISPAYDSQQ